MVKLLRIPILALDQQTIRLQKTDRFALVDTQPHTGNNSFPAERRQCHIVIDHHARNKNYSADFVDIRPGEGCTTTLLLEYFRSFSMKVDPPLATACIYAIASETQDLGREATRADREAFLQLSPWVQLRVLGRIRHPARKREYYRTIASAMKNVRVAKNTCICHAGEVSSSEIVAELADFFVAMERITWCLVTGWHRDVMVLSVRTTNPRARADRLMKRIIGRLGKGGGHRMIAGGAIPCRDLDRYRECASILSKRFSARLRRKSTEVFKPLLEEDIKI